MHRRRELVPDVLPELVARVRANRLLHVRRGSSSSPPSLRATPTMAKRRGSSRRSASAYSAGISFLCVRSPEAPKMTSANGSGVCAARDLPRAGSAARPRSPSLRLLHRVAAELVAERRVHLRREVRARRATRSARTARRRSRARARSRRSPRRSSSGPRRSPRRNGAICSSLPPYSSNASTSSSSSHERTTEPYRQMPAISCRSRSNSECSSTSKPSAYACISPYSIPLCTIFTKWPAPDGADVRVAVVGRERREDRLEPLHRLVLAADHQAVADLQPPDAAGDAGVDEVDPLRLAPPRSAAASRGSSSCRRRRSCRRSRRATAAAGTCPR